GTVGDYSDLALTHNLYTIVGDVGVLVDIAFVTRLGHDGYLGGCGHGSSIREGTTGHAVYGAKFAFRGLYNTYYSSDIHIKAPVQGGLWGIRNHYSEPGVRVAT